MSLREEKNDRCIISSEYIDKRALFGITYKEIADYIGGTVSVSKIRRAFVEGTCSFEIYKGIIAFFNKCEYYLGYKNKGREFGSFLSRYRGELGISQYEIGAILNKNIEALQQKINAVEKGKAILSVKEQYDILYYLYEKCLDYKKEYIRGLEKKGKALYMELGLYYPKEIVSNFSNTVHEYVRRISKDELETMSSSLGINEIDMDGICNDNNYVYDVKLKLALYVVIVNHAAKKQKRHRSEINFSRTISNEAKVAKMLLHDCNSVLSDRCEFLPAFSSQALSLKKSERRKASVETILRIIEKYPEKLQAFILEELLVLAVKEYIFGISKFFRQYAEYITDFETLKTQDCVLNSIIANDIRKLSEADINRLAEILAECITLPAPGKSSTVPYYIGKLYQFKTYAGKDGIINNVDKIPQYDMKSKLSDLYGNSQLFTVLLNIELIDEKLTFSEDEWYVYILLILASVYNQDITPFFEELKKVQKN